MFDKSSIQLLYADTVGSRLELYKVLSINPYKAMFRCPICGDSQKNKLKRRGYFLERNNNLSFYCHNGCDPMGFERFLETYHGDLYGQYRFDVIKEWKHSRNKKEKAIAATVAPKKEIPSVMDGLIALQDLADDHPAKQYMINRNQSLDDSYWAEDFIAYVDSKLPKKMGAAHHHPRIVFPLRWENGDIFAISGRSYQGEEPKYLTIKFDDDAPKVWGLNRLNKNRKSFVLEGQLDAKLLDNAIALLGTDGDPDKIFKSKDEYVMVLDNQPRNLEVIGKYEKYIKNGCNICIWPEKLQHKDINDMVNAGISVSSITNTIKSRTFSGIMADFEFKKWKKIGKEVHSNRSSNSGRRGNLFGF